MKRLYLTSNVAVCTITVVTRCESRVSETHGSKVKECKALLVNGDVYLDLDRENVMESMYVRKSCQGGTGSMGTLKVK